MSEANVQGPPPAPEDVREGLPSSEFVSEVAEAIGAGDAGRLAALTHDLDDPEMADLLTVLAPEDRTRLVTMLGAGFRPTVFSELDWAVKDQLVEALPNEQLADAVKELETDDAVYMLKDLEESDQDEILARLPADDRATIERSLEYPEESAGRLMQAEFIAVPPFWTVGQTIDHMRESADLPDRFTSLFVVDADFHLVGTVGLDRLLRTKRPVPMRDIMDADVHTIPVVLDQEEMARQFERHNLTAAAVVDENQRLVGTVTVDDVVEVIEEEAEEDFYRMAGVGDESMSDTVLSIVPARFWWLLVNLGTAVLASAVIALFDATIAQKVSLAVLMPIVASMGGNAGTQTMTVAVRALATRDLGAVNMLRVIARETAVGFLNGLLFAAIMGAIAFVWFGSGPLGLVMGAAIIINLLAAALAGILIPLALERIGIDPAVSSTVFVTTVTDVVGFFSFLGLAAVWLA